MVQVGILPSLQLLLNAATLLLTAAQPCPKPADVKTVQLREVTESKEEGFLIPVVMMTALVPLYLLPVVILYQSTGKLLAERHKFKIMMLIIITQINTRWL